MVWKLLTPEEKEIRMNIFADILQNIQNDPNFLENVITCDESWFFQYDPESKRQSMHWKSSSSPKQKKARQSKSKFKAMVIVFFLTSERLFTWIGCLKVTLLTRSTTRRF